MAKSKNLFAVAKKAAPAKVSKTKDGKIRIPVEDASFFDKVQKLETLQDNMKRDKAKADMISDELRDLSKEKWAEFYEKTSKNPGSVMIEQTNTIGDTAQLMLVPSDKYISVNPERADELREKYGDAIVEEKTTFSFDSDMIELYGEVISNLIEMSDDITESDKEKIIKAVTVFSVSKGTIDNMKDYGDVAEVMEAVKPVVSLKNIEVIKA